MLAVFLALASATLYGAADFLGGLAARRIHTVVVVLVAQASGLMALAFVLPLLPSTTPATPDLVWGGVAGAAVGAGLAGLYRALAVGSMAVVAPTTAVCAVVVPLSAALVLGERPGPVVLVGIALAVVSIVLVSQPRPSPAPGGGHTRAAGVPPGLGLALLAGVGIGVFFFALARAAATAGLWPLLVGRTVAVAMFGLVALGGRRSLRMAAPVAVMVIGGGVLDVLANALYLLATHHGPLSVVVTLSSLYPVSTVALALAVLGERLGTLQGIGIACALIAVLLIVAR